MVPAISEVVVDVDVAAGRVLVRDIPGLTEPTTEASEAGDLRQACDLLQLIPVSVPKDSPRRWRSRGSV